MEICPTKKNTSKNEFIIHPRKSATKYVILLVELKAITQIGLVLSAGEIAFKFNCFSVRQKSLTN